MKAAKNNDKCYALKGLVIVIGKSEVQKVIERVFLKSEEQEVRGRFEITPWIVRHEVQLLINRI